MDGTHLAPHQPGVLFLIWISCDNAHLPRLENSIHSYQIRIEKKCNEPEQEMRVSNRCHEKSKKLIWLTIIWFYYSSFSYWIIDKQNDFADTLALRRALMIIIIDYYMAKPLLPLCMWFLFEFFISNHSLDSSLHRSWSVEQASR